MAKGPQQAMIARTLVLVVVLLSSASLTSADDGVLLTEYIRYRATEDVSSRMGVLGDKLATADAAQVATAAHEWRRKQLEEVRTRLSAKYGSDAQTHFSALVEKYTLAEEENDKTMLRVLSTQLIGKPVASYPELRRWLAENPLKPFLAECGTLLGNTETWAEMAKRDVAVPPLHIWLRRGENQNEPPAKTVSDIDRLRNSEDIATFEASGIPADGPSVIEQLEAGKGERHKAKLERAKAAMEQVAKERRQYEEAYAAKIKKAAETDAAAMTRHAEKLAASEEEAIKQRENSWGRKIKRTVGAAVGATADAFFGGIGARAGQAAIDAIF